MKCVSWLIFYKQSDTKNIERNVCVCVEMHLSWMVNWVERQVMKSKKVFRSFNFHTRWGKRCFRTSLMKMFHVGLNHGKFSQRPSLNAMCWAKKSPMCTRVTEIFLKKSNKRCTVYTWISRQLFFFLLVVALAIVSCWCIVAVAKRINMSMRGMSSRTSPSAITIE